MSVERLVQADFLSPQRVSECHISQVAQQFPLTHTKLVHDKCKKNALQATLLNVLDAVVDQVSCTTDIC